MYDMILTGCLVVDGNGEKPYKANACICDGKPTGTNPGKILLKR